MGIDWHSSGITTSVIGALKRGLTPLERELGIHVCGGRGNYRQAREPAEPPPEVVKGYEYARGEFVRGSLREIIR
jgi:hypothetical protein